jgi:hypothetical protein
MKLAGAILLVLPVVGAQAPLPELRIDATDGGSIVHIRNTYTQPLTAFQIELVDYPGSYFSHLTDEVISGGIPAGAERAYPMTNMLIGAAPDYVKVQAAIYADGSSSGIPERIAQLIDWRRAMLEADRELIRRLQKERADGASKSDVIADLKQWRAGLPPPDRGLRRSPSPDAARGAVAGAIKRLDTQSMEEVLAALRRDELVLAASKPSLTPAK